MNTNQIQFNHQWLTALLLASLILALAAALAWAGASSSIFQSAKIAQDCAYSPQPDQTGPSTATVNCPGADLGKDESGSWPWSPLKSVKGGRPTGGGGGDVHK